MTASENSTEPTFSPTWHAEILFMPPLIAPARSFTYPQRVPGEDDAMARGALLLDIKPLIGGNYLATCALGFRDKTLPTAIYPCPRADDLLALAGGYAYLIDTLEPTRCLHLPLRPVTQVLLAPAVRMIFLAGFHEVVAIGTTGLRWKSARLSWEGVTLSGVKDHRLHGMGWNLPDDRETPFSIDLETGAHEGGGFD